MTLRLRLTLTYGACFLLAGIAMLGITYGLVARETSGPATISVPHAVVSPPALRPVGAGRNWVVSAGHLSGSAAQAKVLQVQSRTRRQLVGVVARANGLLATQRRDSLGTLLTESAVALALTALLSILLGWLLAGRALRPLRTMNARAGAITERNLSERLGGATDRDDELAALAGAFDGVLDRLERAFGAQRRFVANASHELRTPLTLQRALVEVALADPDADVARLRRACERVLAASAQQERVIDALLALARGETGTGERQPVDLAELVSAAVCERAGVETELAPAVVHGDQALLERVVANLLDNAIVHNRPGGRVDVTTAVEDGAAALRVVNDGPHVRPDQVAEILEPFRRLADERTGAGGLGLGLSIVRAIAEAHGGELDVRARPEGGLDVRVRLPAVAPPGATLEVASSPTLLAAP